ncbi:hypothetical protein R1sor_011145 [Riccia sorocarpa]|uniref:Uncharacterized protein n=1 Tax=Riccia sorocarpa TaxID=122646 RepID=A0ABD3I632_9MARC
MHPKKALEVAGFAESIGQGQGVTEQWDKDDLADLIEVGDFFATEAELGNDYDAEFWIIQCTKIVHALDNIHTDAYGSTHEKGSYVLEGIWYQQYGRSPTCFVRYDSAPVCTVAARMCSGVIER